MSQVEQERSQEQREASGSEAEAEQVQQFGTVSYVTVAISAAFVLAGVFFTEPSAALATVVGWITDYLGWMSMLMTSFFLGFAVWLALSRYGKIRLDQPDDRPEFGRFAWFAMLSQAGMGIGLVFWAVSGPVTHYADPPLGLAKPETPDAASLAMQTAFFHWGLHPWAIYAVVGLAVAYFSYRRGMTNLQVSTVFRPLIGDRVDGPIGKAIDI
jgi:glycine betaine transporter